jgi:ribitol 2-dehydrogenase
MAQSLAGRRALVTGASSGIGEAVALALADAGVELVLTGRSAERLDALAARLPGAATTISADLARPEEVERVVGEAGRIDILIANAGLYIPGDAAEGDPDKWDELMAVNVNAVFRLIRGVLPEMIARKAGDIVVTSSVSGHQAIQWEPVYSASKHAIQAFVHGVRRQLGPHDVRIGAVAPGVVLNALWGYDDDARIAEKVSAREGLRSEDVAEAVLFMLTRPRNVTIRDLVILPANQDI